jgi:hypothetical protein
MPGLEIGGLELDQVPLGFEKSDGRRVDLGGVAGATERHSGSNLVGADYGFACLGGFFLATRQINAAFAHSLPPPPPTMQGGGGGRK